MMKQEFWAPQSLMMFESVWKSELSDYVEVTIYWSLTSKLKFLNKYALIQ